MSDGQLIVLVLGIPAVIWGIASMFMLVESFKRMDEITLEAFGPQPNVANGAGGLAEAAPFNNQE